MLLTFLTSAKGLGLCLRKLQFGHMALISQIPCLQSWAVHSIHVQVALATPNAREPPDMHQVVLRSLADLSLAPRCKVILSPLTLLACSVA